MKKWCCLALSIFTTLAGLKNQAFKKKTNGAKGVSYSQCVLMHDLTFSATQQIALIVVSLGSKIAKKIVIFFKFNNSSFYTSTYIVQILLEVSK